MKQRKVKIFRILLYLYLLFLFIVVVMKFYGDVSKVIDRQALIMADKRDGLDNINLIPFATIVPYLKLFRKSFAYTNILANLFLFVPMGFIIPEAYPKLCTYKRTIGISLCIIVMIELFQYVTCLGFCDIDDVILNSIGVSGGYIIFYIWEKKIKSHSFLT
ncbi:VanZ family protein [bacterium 1XD42-8]|jgi:glycopeptide antibiotics resistance protein|nr:VanZ family protein [Lachnospiraceae bacterium]RKJ49593.1 VanZ family protein [bacterium 1XD42-8]